MENGKRTKVKVTQNGPYLVSGSLPLSVQAVVCDDQKNPVKWSTGEQYPQTEAYALCRCGKSKNKPFCDGTHVQDRFDGMETADNIPYVDAAEKIKGPELDLSDRENLCVGAAFCERAGNIWNLVPGSDNPDARKIAIEEGTHCPSGRLVLWDKDGNAIEPDFEPSIGLMVNPETGMVGPILVRGSVPVESAQGVVYEKRNRVTLCRCGKSKNKPFCDGSHGT
jgi:CDGSH-type Zn-finger protein